MNRIAPVQTMDMAVSHHWAVWSFLGDHVLEVYCSDCDAEEHLPLSMEQRLREYVQEVGDVQIVTWVEVTEKGLYGCKRNAI